MDFLRSVHVKPTGLDGTYRRRDFLRAAGIALLIAALLLGAAIVTEALLPGSRFAAAIMFAAAILAAMSMILGAILAVQAISGSRFPIDMLAPDDLTPISLRDRLSQVLKDEWLVTPQLKEDDAHWAVESGVASLYRLAVRGESVEQLTEALATLEWDEVEESGFDVRSTETDRRRAAEQIHALVAEYEAALTSRAV